MTARNDQAAFFAALLDPNSPIPPQLRTWNGSSVEHRFSIHRNNVTLGLIEALEAKFPVVRELAGSQFFRGMARTYLLSRPPRSRWLTEYGDDFPDFIVGFAPAAGLPYLADVAKVEIARLRAYHASDAYSLIARDFADIDQNALDRWRFLLHPSVAILPSRFAIHSLWMTAQQGGDLASIDPFKSESLLVVRPSLDVQVWKLTSDVAVALHCLQQGGSVGDAATLMIKENPQASLERLFLDLISTGMVSEIIPQAGDIS